MSKAIKKELEMKNDGHDLERFQKMLKTVVSVKKEAIKKHETKATASKKPTRKRG